MSFLIGAMLVFSVYSQVKDPADENLDKAMAIVETAIPRAEKDPTRPVYHFRPPAQWMNDPVGTIFHKGYYHVFYEFNPYADTWGETGTHWAHTRSSDLVHWEHLPIAFGPSTELGERRCNSGSIAINDRGIPIAFYNMVPFEGRREHWAVIGDEDLLKWKKYAGNPFLSWKTRDRHGAPEHPYDKEDMPFVFHEDGRTFMVLSSCKIKGKPVVPIYEAEDGELLRWKYRGIMFNGSGECPNFVKLGDKWVLMYGASRWVEYFVGTFDLETLIFNKEKQGIVDYSYGPTHPNFWTRGFYATNTLFDANDRCILFGWVSGFKRDRGWHGCLSLPRIITLDSDNCLVQTPVPELMELRGKHLEVRNLMLKDESRLIDGAQGDTIEIMAEFEPENARTFGLRVRCSEAGEGGVVLRCDGKSLNVAGTEVPDVFGGERKILKLHVFLDRSVMEVFINDGRKAVTRVIYPGEDDVNIAIFAEDGDLTLKSIDVWEMKPIW